MRAVNLFGGPGSGKSTTAAGLFYKMKLQHMSVELVTEYAKSLVYSNRLDDMIDQQEYIFAKQNHQIHRLREQVDWAIVDSPVLLSTVYVGDDWPCADMFRDLVRCSFTTYNNVNIYLQRPEEFQQYGRVHDKEQSEEIDVSVIDMLDGEGIEYLTFQANETVVDDILEMLISKY